MTIPTKWPHPLQGEKGAPGGEGKPGEVSKAELAASTAAAEAKVAAAEAKAALELVEQPTLKNEINLLAKGGGPAKTAAENTAALTACEAALGITGGRIVVPPGWYKFAETPLPKMSVELEGMGGAGSGPSGSIAAKSYAATVFVVEEAAKNLLVVGGTGGTEFRGSVIRNICFLDNSGGLAASAVIVKAMGYIKFIDCSMVLFKGGVGINESGGNSEYNTIENCSIWGCKYGIKGLGPDTTITNCRIKNGKNTDPEPIPGGIGVTISSLQRMADCIVQGFETDVLVTGTQSILSFRTEAVTIYTTKAKRALLVEGSQNIIDIAVTNGASYAEKAIKITGEKNVIRTNLPESLIENLGAGNVITHT